MQVVFLCLQTMLKETFVESIVETLSKEIVAVSRVPLETYELRVYEYADQYEGLLLLSLSHGGSDIPRGMVKLSVGSSFVADNCAVCEVYIPNSLFLQRGLTKDPIKQLVHSLCDTEFIRSVSRVSVIKLGKDVEIRNPRPFASWLANANPDIVNGYLEDFAGVDPDLHYVHDFVQNYSEESVVRTGFSDYIEFCLDEVVFIGE